MATAAPISVGVIDNEETYLNALSARQGLAVNFLKTSDVEELLEWVRQGLVDAVVSDLRMPGRDGIEVLRCVREENAELPVGLMSVFSPNADENRRIVACKLTLYDKHQLDDLLGQLIAEVQSQQQVRLDLVGRVRELETRNASLTVRNRLLERSYEEILQDLVASLKTIPEPQEKAFWYDGQEILVGELIEDIRNLTPRGVKFIGLWRRAMANLRKAKM